MLLTGEGKLLYMSDSVSEHLGHSMVSLHRSDASISRKVRLISFRATVNINVCYISQVDLVAQGDSVYDIIDASDHLIIKTNLSTSSSLEIGNLKRYCHMF